MMVIVEFLRENGELSKKINRHQATTIQTPLTHVLKSAAKARPKSAKPSVTIQQ